ncbi:MAG: ATP-binding cassette domain-containing protein [Novosphingobium sp.]
MSAVPQLHVEAGFRPALKRALAFFGELVATPGGVIGLTLLGLIVLAALFAPLLAPQDPYDLSHLSILDSRLPPGTQSSYGYVHVLGTDAMGRDLFSAILYGLRISLLVGVSSAVIALGIGVVVGLVSAYVGGRVDALMMRLVDLQMSFPAMLVALVMLALMGRGVDKTIIALVTVQWAYYARTVRAAALVEREREYIEAVRGLRLGHARIIAVHLLPNCVAPVLVIGTVQVAHAIALEATLSFLGIGLPETQPSLGLLIANGYQYLLGGLYWISVCPGIALLCTVLAINLVGDRLRDMLNPAFDTMTITPPSLEVSHLTTAFNLKSGAVRAVNDVSFVLRRGEKLGLVGESGSGKSVTGLSILRLVDPPGQIVSGSIRLNGTELTTLNDEQMRRLRGRTISMVFQDPMTTLNPVLTIGQQFFDVLRAHGKVTRAAAMERAEEALRQVGIPSPRERLSNYPHQLSGGMRQRVCIAIALVFDPAVVIADEPTTALDVTIQAQILNLVQRLARERDMAMVWVTHDLSVVAGLCDRVAVMYAGRIIEMGRTEDVLNRPRHPYTLGLIARSRPTRPPARGSGRSPAARLRRAICRPAVPSRRAAAGPPSAAVSSRNPPRTGPAIWCAAIIPWRRCNERGRRSGRSNPAAGADRAGHAPLRAPDRRRRAGHEPAGSP